MSKIGNILKASTLPKMDLMIICFVDLMVPGGGMIRGSVPAVAYPIPGMCDLIT